MVKSYFILFAVLLSLCSCNRGNSYSTADDTGTVTLSTLLQEIGNHEADPCFPVPYYRAKQLTSYDRRSLLPGSRWWHANDDWSGFERYEVNCGRVEKVLFDGTGPGAITRIITTGGAGTANLRFYFDGENEASIVIPGFDISKFPVDIPSGLIYMHEHYPRFQGSSSYYPIPYAESCKITVDDLDRGYVYHVNYREYEPGTEVKTFSVSEARAFADKAEAAGKRMENPQDYHGRKVSSGGSLSSRDSLDLVLPDGENAVRLFHVNVSEYEPDDYAQLMRGLIVSMRFDGTETVRCPLSDFSGAGMGAPEVDNYYMEADGKGDVLLRFVMPYKKKADIRINNITGIKAAVNVSAEISDWKWYDNTLYFHASWRQQNGMETNKGYDYQMAHLSGKGVFKGDVLSLYNWSTRWYGEGDEHIWVDDDSHPSHFGCGTEDYYNTTYAPIHVYHYPFGGAPREDDEASRGYNTFVRVRCLDVIPFEEQLKFEFELISWDGGKVDYSSTVFWYGELGSKAMSPSDDTAALYELPAPVYGDQKQ